MREGGVCVGGRLMSGFLRGEVGWVILLMNDPSLFRKTCLEADFFLLLWETISLRGSRLTHATIPVSVR